MSIDWSAIGVIVAIIGTTLGFLWQYFGVILNLKREFSRSLDKVRTEAKDAEKRLIDMLIEQGNRITKQETKMELFWSAISGAVSSLIKQPVHFRKDELMDRLVSEKLSVLEENAVEDLLELKTILNDELVTLRETKDPKSLAYALALAYIDQILFDKGMIKI